MRKRPCAKTSTRRRVSPLALKRVLTIAVVSSYTSWYRSRFRVPTSCLFLYILIHMRCPRPAPTPLFMFLLTPFTPVLSRALPLEGPTSAFITCTPTAHWAKHYRVHRIFILMPCLKCTSHCEQHSVALSRFSESFYCKRSVHCLACNASYTVYTHVTVTSHSASYWCTVSRYTRLLSAPKAVPASLSTRVH